MGTTAQKLQNIIDSKAAISAAIEAKGGTVPTELTGYGPAIEALPSGGGSSDLLAKVADRSISGAVDLSGAAYVGNYVFQRCYNLTSVNIPDNALSIGQEAFSYTGLTSVNIPDSVTRMGTASFRNCTSMVSATIGNGLTGITSTAFGYCSNLSNVYFKEDIQRVPTLLAANAFANLPTNYKIWVPSALYDDWTTSGNWSNISAHIYYNIGPLGPLSEKTYVKYLDGTISELDIVGELRENSVPNKENARNVQIGNTVTSIGSKAFFQCTNLETIDIPNTVTSFGGGGWTTSPFYGCSKLKTFSIPNGVTAITNYMLGGCSNLMIDLTIPSSVTYIGTGAFSGCPATIVFDGKTMAEVQAMARYPWDVPTGQGRIVCTDGTL